MLTTILIGLAKLTLGFFLAVLYVQLMGVLTKAYFVLNDIQKYCQYRNQEIANWEKTKFSINTRDNLTKEEKGKIDEGNKKMEEIINKMAQEEPLV